MKRRNFLLQSAMASAALVLNQACGNKVTSAAASAAKPDIGLQLYTVRDEIAKGLPQLIEKIAQLGYTHIETFGYNDRKYFGRSISDFRSLLNSNGLKTPSAHVYHPGFLFEGNDDAWKIASEDAAAMGQQYIVIPWLEEKYRGNAESYKKLAARLNDAARISKTYGLKFAYHNHDFEFADLGGQTPYDILLRETDPDQVKMEMDIFWVHYAGKDPVAMMKQHPGRFPLWHVKDMNPATRMNADIGSGSINFKEIFRHKKTSGLDYFFVEQENYDVSPINSIEKSIAYVKKELV